MPEQCPDSAAAMWAKGSQTLSRLERACLCEPRNPSLTAPESELLAAFGLKTMDAVRQRMDERAMLAAYDGAPSALTEILIEHVPVLSEQRRVPNRESACIRIGMEELLETSIDYDPEKLRVTLRFTVTRRHEREGGAVPQESSRGRFYAVTFGVRDGRVLRRECDTIRQAPDQAVAQHDVAVEIATQRMP